MDDDQKDSRFTWFILGAVIALLWFSLNARMGKMEDAIQKLKAKKVDVREQTTDGSTVGEA